LEPGEGRVRAWLFEHAQVLSDAASPNGGWSMELVIGRSDLERLTSRNARLAREMEGA
jgi:GTPase